MSSLRLPPIFDELRPDAHVLIVGATGSGKTTLLRALLARDMLLNLGVLLLDPHGDLARLNFRDVPKVRRNDLSFLDPTDPTCRGVNPLRGVTSTDRHLVVANVVAAVRKLFESNQWGARTEAFLRGAFAAAIELRGGTIADAARMLVDEDHRAWMLRQIRDPQTLDFWLREYAGYPKNFAAEAAAAPSNKLGSLLSSPALRSVLTKSRPRLDPSKALARSSLVLCDLAKGKLGEDPSRFLGGLLLGMFQSALFARTNTAIEERALFRIVVDEATSFPLSILISLLTESRKFGASLVLATQSAAALPFDARASLLGNVGCLVSFRVGGEDAAILRNEFADEYGPKSLTSLGVGEMVVRVAGKRPVLASMAA
jgi:DNA helicase HerA-like ATPase